MMFGFDSEEALSGGIQTTGNYPGKARTPEELMVLQEALKTAPFGDIWNEYLVRQNMSEDFIEKILDYEKKVLVNR